MEIKLVKPKPLNNSLEITNGKKKAIITYNELDQFLELVKDSLGDYFQENEVDARDAGISFLEGLRNWMELTT